jgi:hypothetical protein
VELIALAGPLKQQAGLVINVAVLMAARCQTGRAGPLAGDRGWKQTARRPLALWDCPDHIPEYANAHQPNRFFSCCEAQGTSTELVEVGDLSCRTIKPDSAGISLF